jgi:hypothetical protein
VQGVDLEAEQGLVGLGGEVLEAGDQEPQNAGQGIDRADGQSQQLARMPGRGSGIGMSRHQESSGRSEENGDWAFPAGPAGCRTETLASQFQGAQPAGPRWEILATCDRAFRRSAYSDPIARLAKTMTAAMAASSIPSAMGRQQP